MTRILGISGSLRRGSYNTALLKAGAPLLDAGAELEIALLHGIPLYDGDLEAAEGLTQAVRDLKEGDVKQHFVPLHKKEIGDKFGRAVLETHL